MSVCPNCNFAKIDNQAQFCPSCGHALQSARDKSSKPKPDDDTLDFVVTEKDTDDREFVGGQKTFTGDDDLGLESPEQILEREATAPEPVSADADLFTDDGNVIGSSEPSLPPSVDEPEEPTATASPVSDPKPDAVNEEKTNGVAKLSDEDVKRIEENLYGKASYLSEQDKRALERKLGSMDQLFANTPIDPHKDKPEKDQPILVENEEHEENLPAPKMANRGRAIAYFYKNYIQLPSRSSLYANDELTIAERVYELRPKQFNPKLMIGGGAVLFALLLIGIGSLFISGGVDKDGQIIGIVLDENDQPYLHGATIRFPEIGQTIQSNAQGLFKSEKVPPGTHAYNLVIEDEIVRQDFATVVAGEVSAVVLKPQEPQPESDNVVVSAASGGRTQESSAKPVSEQSTPTKKQTAEKPRSSAASSKDSGKKTASKAEYANLQLKANVEGARVALDGSVLGAGNLTFKRLNPKTYRYEVSKEGYQTARGEIALNAGKTATLEVALTPLSETEKRKSYTAEDFFYSGSSAQVDGDVTQAIADYSQAIKLKPSYADAYMSRAGLYGRAKEWEKAYSDYIKAAEIYQMKKDYSRSLTAYNQAIEIDKKAITGYLGRANVFMALNEERGAIMDFETVIRYDSRNTQAYFGLGEARFKQGSYDKAIDHFKDARSVDSENPLIHQFLMLCYMADDDIKNVKKSYEKFLEVASDADVVRLKQDSRFSAILRVAEND